MSKIKSAVALILITILMLGVCFMCTVSFSYGTSGMYTFNSVVSMLRKDADLGVTLADGNNYVGGGYSAVYYPDGVISAQEYADNLEGLKEAADAAGEDSDEYKAYTKYMDEYDAHGSVYLNKDKVYNADGEVSDSFNTEVNEIFRLLRARLEKLHAEGVRVDLRDDYTFELFLPAYTGAASVALNYFSYTGEVSMGYGSENSADSATKMTLGEGESIRDYIKGVGSGTSVTDVSYVSIDFTRKGQSLLAEWTAAASDSAPVYIFFYVGDNAIIPLTAQEIINQGTIYASGNFTAASAKAAAVAFETSLFTAQPETEMTIGNVVRAPAQFGDLAFVLLLVAFGVLFVGMMAFFVIRYRALAVVHLYTSIIWLLTLILLIWWIPMLHIGVEAFVAVVLAGVLLSLSNVVTFEAARKEYASGKTIASSVKAGYKHTLWQIIDLHAALLLLSVMIFAIALTELQVFALTLLLGVLLSGVCTLLVNRFLWACFMSFAKNKAAFCTFKREERDDD